MTEAQRIARRVRIAYDRFHRTGNAAPLAPLRAEVSRAWLAAHAERDGTAKFWLRAASARLDEALHP
jgi:hypothetical protein